MFVERLLDPLIKLTGFTSSEISFVISILFCFVNGYVFRTTFGVNKVSTITRHYVSIISGVTVLLFCFGSDIVHLITLTVVGYCLTQMINRKHIHKYVFIYALSYNFIVHLLQMYDGKETAIDITAPMMFATIRMTYIGFEFYDTYMHNHKGIEDEKIHDKNKNDIEREFPTLLEVISYMFFFSSILVGPPSSFQAYKDFIEGKDIGSESDRSPSPMVPALRKFLMAVFFIGGRFYLNSFDISPLLYKDLNLLSTYPFWKKIIYAELILYWVKCKYYIVFYFGEACVNMVGFGFNGYDQHGNALWDGLININPIEYEKSHSMKDAIGSWNIQTLVWLRKCVYSRVSRKPILATFMVTSVWHGAFLGYYVFCLSVAIASYPQKIIRKKLLPYLESSESFTWFYWSINFIITRLLNQYLTPAFVVLDMYLTFSYWRFIYFYGHWIILFGYVVAFLLPDYRKIEIPKVKKSN